MQPWSAPNSEEPALLPLPEVEKGLGKSLGASLQQGPLGTVARETQEPAGVSARVLRRAAVF